MKPVLPLPFLMITPVALLAATPISGLPRPTTTEIHQAWDRANQKGDFDIFDVIDGPWLKSASAKNLQIQNKNKERAYFFAAVEDCINQMNSGKPIELHRVFGFGLPGIVPDFDPDSGVPLEWIGCVVDEKRDVADSANRWTLGWYRSRGILPINSQARRMLWLVPKELTWCSLDSPIDGMTAEIMPIKRPLLIPPRGEQDWFTYHFLKIRKPDSSMFTLEEDFDSANAKIFWAFHKNTQSLWIRFERPGPKGRIPIALQLDLATGHILTVHPLLPDNEVDPPEWLELIRPTKKLDSQVVTPASGSDTTQVSP